MLSSPEYAALGVVQPTGSVAISNVTVNEGNGGTPFATFTVTRTGGTAPFKVNFGTADGTATVADSDYMAASGTLTFGTNVDSRTISVKIKGDTKIEGNETFAVNLSGATNGAAISDGQGIATIKNDDVAPAGSVTVSNVIVTEGNSGTKLATFTVTRTGGTAPFKVDFGTADGTATVAGGDYLATSGTLTFGAGVNSQTISVKIKGDTKFEPNETFAVNLSKATNGAVIRDGQGIATIKNDDVSGSVTISDVAITEGNKGTKLATFTVTRTGGKAPFEVKYATADKAATIADKDYVGASGTLAFGANVDKQTISVKINGDTRFEANETFAVNLSGATNGAVIRDGQGIATITNDDAATVGSIAISDVTISEGDKGAKLAIFTVTRTGGTAAFDVHYETANGTATLADRDYVAASGTLAFGAGVNSRTFSVKVNGDTRFEADETFAANLSGATNGAIVRDGKGIATIRNDDPVLAGAVTISNVTLSEGNSGVTLATFTVTRTGGTAAFKLGYSTADGTATVADGDYVATSGTLTFGANVDSQTISVKVNGDARFESNETFAINLSGATNGAQIRDGQGIATIKNDDLPPAGSITISDVTVVEGDNGTKLATFTVTRTGGTTAFTVNYATADGTATVADQDYVAASGTLTFGVNVNSKTVSVKINGDTRIEPDETFSVNLSAGTNGATIADSQGIGTIKSNDLDPEASVFSLNSKPNSHYTIYLDFDGGSLANTAWDYPGAAPGFDLDGNASTFSGAEIDAIREIFYRVAEDFAPFDVNVTTEWHGQESISRSSFADTVYGTVCLISAIGDQIAPNAGGIAYSGVFDSVDDYYKPALVFPEKLHSARNIADAISHEVGHNLGLSHDGTSSVEYYAGQGFSPGWAPIMGVGYGEPLTQWSNGGYPGANNNQDDLATIQQKGPSIVADDFQNGVAFALQADPTNPNRFVQHGLIGSGSFTAQGNDVDKFYFDTGAGTVNISVVNALSYTEASTDRLIDLPSGYGDLRIDCHVYDSTGGLVYDWNENNSIDANFSFLAGTAGRYFLEIDGVGSSTDGESDYGSLGGYDITVVRPGSAPQALSMASYGPDPMATGTLTRFASAIGQVGSSAPFHQDLQPASPQALADDFPFT